ncbi:LolA family protein [Saccharopolyspora taberi]|uniref:Sigma-E factor regulatory protein RseB domain-containing protein n=1 Tax=Saccharopolyspora taberi TaxID=60895 RepID=A0ABN3VJQ4_9PSEU
MKRTQIAATAGIAAGVVGLTALALPTGAGADPVLPPVAPEALVESVLTATPPALAGTVEVDNELGLPAVPGAPEISQGDASFQVWADGQGRHRVSIPSPAGETTVVNDGATVWKWNAEKRQVVKAPHHEQQPRHEATDPAALSRQLVDTLRRSSDVTVDGTASVAGRDAYELVLTPKPTERTVLREVRIAVDSEKRIPLAVTVNTNGSDNPALRVGFSNLDLSQPDAALFQFTAPPGAQVEEAKPGPEHKADHPQPTFVGDGWDTVVRTALPAGDDKDAADPVAVVKQIGKPVNGPWGQGWIVTTKAGSALVTADGQVLAGAVPEQVLTEALGNR